MLTDAEYFARANADADALGLGKSHVDRGEFVRTSVAIARAFDRQRACKASLPARVDILAEKRRAA
jgi:predicted transcriptional regulator